ncbi:MAG TPA: hypothetical protein VGE00_00465 [Gammaproteobacteria bacterium]
MRNWIARAAGAGLLLLVLPLMAAVNHDSSLHWQTLHSPHFTIHFHQQGEGAAREVLAMAEGVHQRLSPLMQWQPQGPTEIVLTDEFDLSNGWATPYPSNRMTLYMAAPDALDGLEDHGGWLELVFTHEYLHILHLDKASGAPAVLRKIFGRHTLLFPNALQPNWFTEGLATHVETDRERGIGRGQSSYYDMLMRMETLGGIKPLRQVNQPLASWPMGNVPYLYGVHFYAWLEQQYGEEKVTELVNNYSNNVWPFLVNSNAYQTTGKDLDTLWAEFSAALQTRYDSQAAGIAARGVSAAQRLTHDGYMADALVAGAADELYYTGFDAMHRPALMRLRNGETQRLAELAIDARLAYHPRQKLLVAQPEICHGAALYYDLYRYDENGNGRQRLTHCSRYRNAAWAPDGQAILAVHNENGFNELHLLDSQGTLQKKLWRGEQREIIGALDWSAQSGQIAAALWQAGQGWDLALFDMETAQWRMLTHSSAIEQQVRFTPDGQQLLYSADYSGVYNLYTLNLANKEIQALTNVVGGAFAPALVGGQLLYAGYDAAGFDLYRQPFTPRVEPVAISEGSGAIASPPYPEVATSEPRDYSPLKSVRPRWWFPHLMGDEARTEIGVITGGSDTLDRHLYALDVAYDAHNHWGVGSVDYIYDRWTPIFKLHGERSSDITLDDEGNLLKFRRESAGVAEIVTPWRRYYSKWALHAGVVQELESDGVVNDAAYAQPELRDRVAGLAISHSSVSEMPRGVSRVDGRELLMVAEDSDVLPRSDFNGRALLIDWKEFIRLSGEHVLALRGVAARGDEGIRPYELGGIGQVNYLPMLFGTNMTNTPFNRRSYALRGYAEGLPQLSGTQMRMASLEYRYPLERIERGFMGFFPVGLHQLHGALFADTGVAWDYGASPGRYYTGYGFEVSADIVFAYGALLPLSFGYAYGVEEVGGNQFYLRLGASF